MVRAVCLSEICVLWSVCECGEWHMSEVCALWIVCGVCAGMVCLCVSYVHCGGFMCAELYMCEV